MHKWLQALFMVIPYHALFNVVYSITIVDLIGSWTLTWWIDRRFPFSMMPLWAFTTVSVAALFLCLFLAWINRPERFRLLCDKINWCLCILIIGIFAWMVLLVSLIHTYYIGDFCILRFIPNVIAGRYPFDIPFSEVDVFPTFGDTVIISYLLSFLLLYLANWHALTIVNKSPHYEVIRTKSII